MLYYSHLRSWRNLCEFLDTRWYKFAKIETIKNGCKGVFPNFYDPRCRLHRKTLWDNYLIQFIRWGEHPITTYSHSRTTRREYKDVRGWILVSEWEAKIAYLEHLILFEQEPLIKSWESSLNLRMNERNKRQEKIKLCQKLSMMKDPARKLECASLGVCWRCFQEIIPLMVDCVSCGAPQ